MVMTYFLLRDYNILPKKELHWSPWVDGADQISKLDLLAEGAGKQNKELGPLSLSVHYSSSSFIGFNVAAQTASPMAKSNLHTICISDWLPPEAVAIALMVPFIACQMVLSVQVPKPWGPGPK